MKALDGFILGILFIILFSIFLEGFTESTAYYQKGYEAGSKNISSELIYIQLDAIMDIRYKESDMGFNEVLVCNITSGNCGNDIYYNKGKGFYWGGFLYENYTGMTLEAKIQRQKTERSSEE